MLPNAPDLLATTAHTAWLHCGGFHLLVAALQLLVLLLLGLLHLRVSLVVVLLLLVHLLQTLSPQVAARSPQAGAVIAAYSPSSICDC